MASVYASFVSQKLAFARMHLRLWQQTEQTKALSTRATVQSFRESTLFHAINAYHGFLQELAHFYQLKTGAEITLDILEETLSQNGRVSPEVVEIKNLLQSNDSWLSQLLMHYERCLLVHEVIEPKTDPTTDENMIAVTVVDDEEELLLTSAQCDDYLNQLREYIDRVHESTMSEW